MFWAYDNPESMDFLAHARLCFDSAIRNLKQSFLYKVACIYVHYTHLLRHLRRCSRPNMGRTYTIVGINVLIMILPFYLLLILYFRGVQMPSNRGAPGSRELAALPPGLQTKPWLPRAWRLGARSSHLASLRRELWRLATWWWRSHVSWSKSPIKTATP